MKCHACGKELTKKELLFTEDKLPFCNNPLTCNDEHPNSVKNILARQGAAQMFTEEQLETNTFENLNVSDEMKERIVKIATKPQSIRLSKVDIAYYLIQLQDKHNFTSLSEAIRHCVHVAMNLEPAEDIPAPVVEVKEPAAETNLVTEQSGGIKVVIGEKDFPVTPPETKTDANPLTNDEEEEDFVF